jgi:hypothetical protein
MIQPPTPPRTAYIAGRYLAAFDEAQAFYGATDDDMDFDPRRKTPINLALRRYIVHAMRMPEIGHRRLMNHEIAAAVGVCVRVLETDVAHLANHGIPDTLPPRPKPRSCRTYGPEQLQRQRERSEWRQRRKDAALQRELAKQQCPEQLQAIVGLVCRRLGVDTNDVRGTNRTPTVVAARWLISGLARKQTRASFPKIAAALGRPNCHSTAIEGDNRFRAAIQIGNSRMLLDRPFSSWADQLDAEVGAMLAGWKSGAA